MIHVAICDSCPAIRVGLRTMISTAPDIDIALETSSRADILSKMDDLDVDVILLDIDDEMQPGYQYIDELREKLPAMRIMVFTNCRDYGKILGVLEHGIQGIQCKADANAKNIVDCVRALHKGDRNLAPCLTKSLPVHVHSEQLRIQSKLSAREQEVLNLIAKGYSNSDIANKLFISVGTVKFHVSAIFSKLHVKNRTEAALRIL